MQAIYPIPSGKSFIALSNKIDQIVETRDYQNYALEIVISKIPELEKDEEYPFIFQDGLIKFTIKKSSFQTQGIFIIKREDGTSLLLSKNYHDLIGVIGFMNRVFDF